MTESSLNLTRVKYGKDELQFAVVGVPDGHGTHPVVILIHGGFWRNPYRMDLMEPLQADLVSRGFAAYNLEYRAGGDEGGGYPGTLNDVAAGVDYLAEIADDFAIDLDRAAVVGHSAGGHLALWCGSRHLLAPGSPGADPALTPKLVVGQAAVVDLYQAAADGLGDNATQNFIGGEPGEAPEAYAVAQPVLDPDQTVLVHGDIDDRVPLSQSTAVADQVKVIVIEGEHHFHAIEPSSELWAAVIGTLKRL